MYGNGHCIRAVIGTHRVIQKLETDYFGGTGTQGGVLYENGQISIAARSGEWTSKSVFLEDNNYYEASTISRKIQTGIY